MHITGSPDGPPTQVGYAITDVLCAHQLSTAILAALLQRNKTGKGQHIQTNLLHSALYSQSYVVSSSLIGDRDYTRMGNAHPLIAPYSVYKTSDDKWIVIGVATDAQFSKFCKVVGIEDESGLFNSNKDRLNNREQLDSLINSTFKSKGWTLSKLDTEFTKEGIPFSISHSIQSLFQEPDIQEIENDLVKTVESQNYKRDLKFIKTPITFSDMPTNDPADSPLLGQHTGEILQEVCNYDQDYIEWLKDKQIV